MNFVFLGASPFLNAYFQSDFLGKFIFIALFGLSILSWIILIDKICLTRKAKNIANEFHKLFKNKKQQPLHLDCKNSVSGIFNPFLDLYNTLKQQALEILQKNKQEKSKNAYLSTSDIEMMGHKLTTDITHQVKQLESNLFILATIVSLAPFLGLLGTVWGILVTFAELQSSSLGGANDMVLGGISMALATTVFGLIVAIPALIAYNYLKNSIRNFEIEMHGFSSDMLAAVELRYRQVDVKMK